MTDAWISNNKRVVVIDDTMHQSVHAMQITANSNTMHGYPTRLFESGPISAIEQNSAQAG